MTEHVCMWGSGFAFCFYTTDYIGTWYLVVVVAGMVLVMMVVAVVGVCVCVCERERVRQVNLRCCSSGAVHLGF